MLPEFNNPLLLKRAVTHASYANEHETEDGCPVEDNERLEFLGDAILDFIAAAWLYERFPDVDEGRLTTLRAALVRASTLSRYAESIGIPERLRLGRGEKEGGGKHRINILGDAFEAVLGALYIDQGFDAAYRYFVPLLEIELDKILDENRDRDAKSQLQEWSQANLSITPRYRLASIAGPDHARIFTVQVWIGSEIAATGSGTSKQGAEQMAAREALISLMRKAESGAATQSADAEVRGEAEAVLLFAGSGANGGTQAEPGDIELGAGIADASNSPPPGE